MPGPIRRPLQHRRATTVIDAEAIALFDRGVRRMGRLERTDEHPWQDRTLLDISYKLAIALRLKPWNICPLDCYGREAPWPWMKGELEIADWHCSKGICAQLEAALKTKRRVQSAKGQAPDQPTTA